MKKKTIQETYHCGNVSIVVEGATEEERLAKMRKEMSRLMSEADAQHDRDFDARIARIRQNDAKISKPANWHPPARTPHIVLELGDAKHKAFVVDAQVKREGWDTDHPCIMLTCGLVWGRCDAATFILALEHERLTPETAWCGPFHIREISLRKWLVRFSNGETVPLDVGKLDPINDMRVIRDNANMQRVIERHFQKPDSGTVYGRKEPTPAQIDARRKNGLARSRFTNQDKAKIRLLWNDVKTKSKTPNNKSGVARAVRVRCAEQNITTKDKETPTIKQIKKICDSKT